MPLLKIRLRTCHETPNNKVGKKEEGSITKEQDKEHTDGKKKRSEDRRGSKKIHGAKVKHKQKPIIITGIFTIRFLY